jgi:hypothetical protein
MTSLVVSELLGSHPEAFSRDENDSAERAKHVALHWTDWQRASLDSKERRSRKSNSRREIEWLLR